MGMRALTGGSLIFAYLKFKSNELKELCCGRPSRCSTLTRWGCCQKNTKEVGRSHRGRLTIDKGGATV
eukprot:scaffold316940_cov32-Tisochrysis_lutea.AAC.3